MINRVKNLKEGDYVMASKYQDGDPHDHFVIGFFDGMLYDNKGQPTNRFMVKNSKGVHFRANGFRRCERISQRVGDILVNNINIMEMGSCSVWYWRHHPQQLQAIAGI